MNLSRPLRLLLGLASGVALALSFPNYNLSLLAWVAIAMLILASIGASVRDAMLAGFLHGIVFYPVCLTWIYVVMREYGNVPVLPAAAILGGIGFLGGLHMMIFTSSVRFISRRSVDAALMIAPLLWVAVELIRAHLPIIAFPWNLSGYAASGNLAFVQLTSLTGIYGLSLLIAAFNAVVAWVVYRRERRAYVTLSAFALALVLVAGIGPHLVPQPQTPRYVAHLVQTNFPQSESYPADWLDIHAGEMNQLESISVDAARREPGLIVWPEVPAPFSFSDPKFAERAQRIAREAAGEFLVGVVDWKKPPGKPWQATNSATLLNPLGQRIFTYDKIRLVPFGEYVPLRQWLTFAGRLTADLSDFTPGTQYSVGQLPGGRFGVYICYEAIFQDEVRHFSKNGAELLINLSNDGWFGRSSAPSQHLMMARVRAVENRRWLLRDTNNGYTEDIDPYGRTVAEMQTDIRGQMDAPYDFRSDVTLFARWGDWIAWLCLFASMALMLYIGQQGRADASAASKAQGTKPRSSKRSRRK
jgi:apolipoprotein N-acyltransferase